MKYKVNDILVRKTHSRFIIGYPDIFIKIINILQPNNDHFYYVIYDNGDTSWHAEHYLVDAFRIPSNKKLKLAQLMFIK